MNILTMHGPTNVQSKNILAHALQIYFLKVIFIISSHPRLGLPSDLFPSVSSLKSLCTYLVPSAPRILIDGTAGKVTLEEKCVTPNTKSGIFMCC